MFYDTLKLAKYRFTLEAIDEIKLPAYKGSAFHGGFGHALMQISPTWYRYFFEPSTTNNNDWPKPFIILPPLDEQEVYPKGHRFYCELTLIGEATQHYSICYAAIEYLGMQMGLGYYKGKYKIIATDKAVTGSRDEHQSHSVSAKDIINFRVPTLSPQQQSFVFPTRLRLKKNNRLHRSVPSFQLLFERLIARLKTLEKAYGAIDTQHLQDNSHLLAKAADIMTQDHAIHWDDWNRFSGRQKQWMKFGGLKGSITYTGDLAPYLPCLALGEWLHLGGKTSFGLGKYKMETLICNS